MPAIGHNIPPQAGHLDRLMVQHGGHGAVGEAGRESFSPAAASDARPTPAAAGPRGPRHAARGPPARPGPHRPRRGPGSAATPPPVPPAEEGRRPRSAPPAGRRSPRCTPNGPGAIGRPVSHGGGDVAGSGGRLLVPGEPDQQDLEKTQHDDRPAAAICRGGGLVHAAQRRPPRPEQRERRDRNNRKKKRYARLRRGGSAPQHPRQVDQDRRGGAPDVVPLVRPDPESAASRPLARAALRRVRVEDDESGR